MPSRAHEDMVARLVAAGMRPSDVRPSDDAFAAMRAQEAAAPRPGTPGVQVDQVQLGPVPALRVRAPGAGDRPTVVFLHGGGYIWLSPWTHLGLLAAIARETGGTCLGLEYRRAPEHPFPAAVDDVVAAYRALLGVGTEPVDVAFAGDSAGGGLVLGALVALRDAGVALPAAGACISPWTDLAVTGASVREVDDPLVSGASLRMMAAVYLAGADPTAPTASPLHADLTGLPPLLVQVGTREALLDDARRVVARARAAGADATLVEHPGVVHMWVVHDPDLPESREAVARIGSFLRRVRGGPPTGADDTAARFRRLAAAFTDRVRAVPAGRWDDPTPCTGWMARDVVGHLVSWMPALFLEPLGRARPAGPDVADDPVGAWEALRDALQSALDDPELATRRSTTPAGTLTLDDAVASFGLADVLVHTWDLARATGGDERLDADEVQRALDGVGPRDEEAMVASGHYAPRVAVPADAPAQDRLLALMGRRP